MKTLHIFQKDVRHLWPQIVVFLALMAAAAFLDPVYTASSTSGAHEMLSFFVLKLACWSLLIAVIHEEKLPGDRQYWLTRPLSWRELLAAKALFVAAFIQLPLFLYHVVVLMATGIPLAEHLSTLLWRQFFFAAFYILPVAVIAAVTRSLGQVILTGLLALLPFWFLQNFLFTYFRMVWSGDGEALLTLAMALILTAGVTAILFLQYSRRLTRWSRVAVGALGVLLVATFFTGNRVLRAASRPREIPSVRLTLDQSSNRKSTVMPSGRPDLVTVDLPVRLDGVPSNVEFTQNSMSVSIESGARKLELPMQGGLQRVAGNEGWLTIYVQRGYFDLMVAGHAVTVYGSVDFTAFGDPREYPLPRGRWVVVPKVGACIDRHDSFGLTFACYTPFPRASVSIGTAESHRNWIIPHGFATEPLPTASGFDPLMRFTSQLPFRSWSSVGDAHLFAAQPLPPVRVSFEFRGVNLDRSVVQNFR